MTLISATIMSSLLLSALVGDSCGQQRCLSCTSETFLNSDFSNFDVLEDKNCERGNRLPEFLKYCSSRKVCITIDGIAGYSVQGYGKTETKYVVRDCVDPATLTSSTLCMTGSSAENYVTSLGHQLELDYFVQMSTFDGTVCPCYGNDYCNDGQVDPVAVHRPHTPAPGAKGLQCITCLHLDIPSYDSIDYDNPYCEKGDLSHPDVFYHTCSGDGACAVIDGWITQFGIRYRNFERTCIHGFLNSYPQSQELVCLSRRDVALVSDQIFDYDDYYYFGDVEFDGDICYCTSDLCNTGTRRNNSAGLFSAILAVMTLVTSF